LPLTSGEAYPLGPHPAGGEHGGHVPPQSDRLAAEGELFHACYPRLAGWGPPAWWTTTTQAHEIASEAFTRLLARWSSLDNPQSYLYMIRRRNLIRDHWRKVGRERARHCAR